MSGPAVNPTGAGFFNFIDNGSDLQYYVIDPDVGNPSPFGTVMEIEDYAGPGETNPPVVPLVQPSSTSQDDNVVGVLIEGLAGYSGMSTSVPAGKVGQIMVQGICQVLCDATTSAGEALIASPDTPGCAQTTSAPTTRTIGLCLEDVTIDSGTALVWCYVGPGGQGPAAGSETLFTEAGQLLVGTGPGTGDLLDPGAETSVLQVGADSALGWGYPELTSDAANIANNVTLTADAATAIITTASLGVGTWIIWAAALLEYGSEATGLISLEAAVGTATATLVGQLAAPLPAVAVLTAADPTPVSLVFRAVVTVAGTIVISGDNADAAVAGTALKEDPTTSKLATGYVALQID